jgi:hypothetical protein
MGTLKAREPEDVEMEYALGQRRSASDECMICTSNMAEDGVKVDFKLADGSKGFYCRPCILRLGRVLKAKLL